MSADTLVERIKRRREQEAANAPQPEAAAPATQGNLGDAALQGLTFGFADELAGVGGGVVSAIGGGSYGAGYDATTQRMRDRYAAVRERRPRMALGAEIAGALPTAVIPMGAMANAARGVTTAGRVGRGALGGAITGGVYEAGQGEGAMDRAVSGAGGAVTGGAIGGAVPAVGAGVSRIAGAVRSRVAPSAADRAGVTPGAQRYVERALEGEGETLETAAQRAQQYGSDAMLMDTSPTLRQRGESISNFGRPGAEALESAVRARRRRANTIVQEGFDDVVGEKPDVANLQRALAKRVRERGNQTFEAARAANAGRPVNTSELLDVLAEDLDMSVADLVNVQQNTRALPEERMAREFGQYLTTREGGQIVDFDRLDRVRKQIHTRARDMLSSSDGERRYQGRILMNYHDMLVEALDDASDDLYSRHRAVYREDSAVRDAFQRGRQDITGTVDPSEVRERMGNMTPEEAEAYRQGARAAMGRMMSSVRGGTRARNEVLTDNTAVGEKLRLVFGDEQFDALMQRMEGAEAMAQTDRVVPRFAGSKTSRMQNSEDAPFTATTGLWPDIKSVGAGAVNYLDDAMVGGGTRRSLGTVLSAQGGERDRIIRILMDEQRRRAARNRYLDRAVSNAGRPIAGPADPQRDIPTITVRPAPR